MQFNFTVPSKYYTTDVAHHGEDSFLLEEADVTPIDWTCEHYLSRVARIEWVRKANSVPTRYLPRLVLSLAAYERIARGHDETLREAFQNCVEELVNYYLEFGRSMTAYRYGFGASHRFEWLSYDGRIELPLVVSKDGKVYRAPFSVQLAKGRSRLSRRNVKVPEGMRPVRLVIEADDEMIEKNRVNGTH